MKLKYLHYYSSGIVKPIYHVKPGDRVQLSHGPGLVTKINKLGYPVPSRIRIFIKDKKGNRSAKTYSGWELRNEFIVMYSKPTV